MSRGRTGIIKALKEVFREVKFFGDAEISNLKKELEAHKLSLEQMKAARAERARREEALALLEMRKAVEALQEMEGQLAEQGRRMDEAVDELTERAMQQQERDMTDRALRLAQGISSQDFLLAEETELRQQLARLQSDIQTLGTGGEQQPQQPSAGGAAPAGGKAGKKRR